MVIGDFGWTGCFPGVTPVDELLFEQSRFIVLSQSSKHRPVRATLTFPTTQDNVLFSFEYHRGKQIMNNASKYFLLVNTTLIKSCSSDTNSIFHHVVQYSLDVHTWG